MSGKKTILFLYSEVMEYLNPIFTVLTENDYNVIVFTNIKKRTTPLPKFKDEIKIYDIGNLNYIKFRQIARSYNSEIVYVSGWMELIYMFYILEIKWKRGRTEKIVVGFDDKWSWSLKKILGWMIGRFRVLKLFYDYAWVSGPYQFEYAKNMGFYNNEIIYDLLSANPIFNLKEENNNRVNNFIYAGRFSEEKGVMLLLDAWDLMESKLENWNLILIGKGNNVTSKVIEKIAKRSKNIKIVDFADSKTLSKIFANSKCGIVPSYREQWGVVLHEFCMSGMTIISSEIVGANSIFIIDGYNGYTFKSNDVRSLAEKIQMVASMNDVEIRKFQRNSIALSKRVSVETSVANLLSLVRK